MKKEIGRYDIVGMIITAIVFAIVVMLYSYCYQKKLDSYISIAKELPLEILVSDVTLDRGAMVFNSRYLLNALLLSNSHDEIVQVWHSTTPFTLQKKADSDTIYFLFQDQSELYLKFQ